METYFPFFRPVVCGHDPGVSGGQTVPPAEQLLEWYPCCQGSPVRLPGTAAPFLHKERRAGVAVVWGALPSLIREVPSSNLSTTETVS